MTRHDPWSRYRQIATQTASPGQLVLMLFEGAISFLERSQHGFSLEDPAERNGTIGNNILKAQAILDELNQSLDLTSGGELARTLRDLYQYLNRRLLHSNIHKDPEGVREVLRHLGVLRDAWREMLQRQPQDATAPAALTVAAA